MVDEMVERMKSRKTIYLLATLLVAATVSFGFRKFYSSSDPSILDLSKSRKVENIPWIHEDPKRTLIHNYNCRLIVRFDADHSFEGDVTWVSLEEEGGVVISITIALPNQTAKDAYHTALKLANYW